MACDHLTRALAGEPVDRAHVAGCPVCGAVFSSPAVALPAVPSARAFRARARRRNAVRGAVAAAAVLLAVGAWLGRGEPPFGAAPDPDLYAALDEIELGAELELTDPPGTEALALLDPDDPTDQLLDAFIGEGSL